MAGTHAGVAASDPRFQAAYAVIHEAVREVFPDADPVHESGMVGWKAPRHLPAPAERIGTFDPDSIFVGVADRRAGPTLHVWHPGAYDLLDRNAAWLKEAGFQVMKGCLAWTRRQPVPADAVRRLLLEARRADGP